MPLPLLPAPRCPAPAAAPRPTRRRLLALAAAGALAGPSRFAAAEAAPLRLGTSTPGGGFALYGETLQRLLTAPGGRPLLQARPTRGTEENLALLRAGALDAALVQGTAADELLAAGEAQPLRILFAMYPSPGLLAVPAASPATRLEDLRGQPVVFGVRASGLVTLARRVFDGLGLDLERDFQALFVERAADGPTAVLEGRARGLWGAGEGWPGFLRLAAAPGGARFLAPQPAQIPAILARHPRLQAMELPAGTYAGIESPLPTVGSVNVVLVREDLAPARAAAVLQALQAAGPALAAALPQAAFSTLENTRRSAPSPALLHPAAR
ncbi:TAXI family TRAP transporter solute-binding subunit [Piscinibacter sakaiensis]|uniref:TAXI family TRAP transporter solute-binding subunit n=1 Tax=Piscinibacter sakaiensis TaxID=1547922 RepID=A0A0K8NWN0_PISS1|nr:TAXI family TRAP transporter solute-binding subunit [Piscinibacter sakaiensis]GAP34350.1 hypothetical protein ISF6_4525 [Piscinibacter sakaiensis]